MISFKAHPDLSPTSKSLITFAKSFLPCKVKTFLHKGNSACFFQRVPNRLCYCKYMYIICFWKLDFTPVSQFFPIISLNEVLFLVRFKEHYIGVLTGR